jgi:uncharacterized protein
MPLLLDRAAEVGGVRMTNAGYMVAQCRVAKANCVQHYHRSELGLPATAPETIGVLRDESEIFHADSMRSWAFRPLTLDHPPGPVDATNWRAHAVGFIDGHVARDGDYLVLNLMVADADAQQVIRDGRKELSAGYTLDLDWTPGVTPSGEPFHAVARRVRGDHVAAVAKGRAGPECAIALDDRAPNPAHHPPGATAVSERTTIVVDGQSIETDRRAAEIIQSLSGQNAALRSVVQGQQPLSAGQRIDFRDQRLADWLSAGAAEAFRQRAARKFDESDPWGAYCKRLRDGWKSGRTAA